MPIKWKSKILLAKIETAYATDPTPTGAANAILATNVTFQPMEGQDVSRGAGNCPGLQGPGRQSSAGLHSRISFRVEMVGPSGDCRRHAGLGSLAACLRGGRKRSMPAFRSPTTRSRTAMKTSPSTSGVGATRAMCCSVTRGTCVLRFNAQAIPYSRVFFLGSFLGSPPSRRGLRRRLRHSLKPDLVTHARTSFRDRRRPRWSWRNFSLDLGNDVQPRFPGRFGKHPDRRPAPTRLLSRWRRWPLSTWNPYSEASEQNAVFGRACPWHGRRPHCDARDRRCPKCSGLQDSITTRTSSEWPINLVPQPVSGNDQWTLTLT